MKIRVVPNLLHVYLADVLCGSDPCRYALYVDYPVVGERTCIQTKGMSCMLWFCKRDITFVELTLTSSGVKLWSQAICKPVSRAQISIWVEFPACLLPVKLTIQLPAELRITPPKQFLRGVPCEEPSVFSL